MRYQNATWQNNLVATPSATQWGTRLTAHATPHDKGAYATLMTTTYDVYGFWLGVNGSATAATQTDMLMDIAIGPAQEHVIVPTLPVGWRSVATGASPGELLLWFPIYIPAGTLVSARIQALITIDTLDVVMFANAGSAGLRKEDFFTGCDAYGVTLAASQGTSHTPGNTGALSTAADIGSVTSKDYGAVMFMAQGTLANTTMNTLAYHWELVRGGQTVCVWYAGTTSSEFTTGPFPPAPFHRNIPAGTQLQVRGECSGTAQAQDVILHCFY